MDATRIRVLFGNVPPLLGDILRDALASAPDIVASELPPQASRGVEGDVIVLALCGDCDEEECWRLVYASPEAKVLGIRLSDGHTTFYELRPNRLPLGELSPSGFVDAVRRAGRAGRRN